MSRSMSDHNAQSRPASEPPAKRGKLGGLLEPVVVIGSVLVVAGWIFFARGTPQESIAWSPCFDDPKVLCARVSVPTDHHHPSDGRTILSMAKVPADPAAGQRLGSVYTNPGGPGGSGRSFCQTQGAMVRNLVGGRFDIICWDPRGIGRTEPAVNCWGDAVTRHHAVGNTVLDRTFEVPEDPLSPEGTAVLVHQQREALRLMDLQADQCSRNMGADTLKWMGTTTLIRDMEFLKNLIDGEEELINFFGGSYGTVVAGYLVNMLPAKVGAVIAHGVADPTKWAIEHYETYELLGDLLLDSDAAYKAFLEACHAEAENCPLARKDVNTTDSAIQVLFRRLRDTGGVIVRRENAPNILTSGMARLALFNGIQDPSTFRDLVAAFGAATRPDPDYLPLLELTKGAWDPPKRAKDGFLPLGQGDLARLAVSCADSPPYADGEACPTAEGMVEGLQKYSLSKSSMFGATVNLMEQHGGCQFWPRGAKPAPRFDGPWNSTLKTPMLVVSNEFDPITPVAQGKLLAERHGRSARHLIQDGIGHSYEVEPNSCFAAVAKRYFETRQLPDEAEIDCVLGDRKYFSS